GRELQRAEALAVAARALQRRDQSEQALALRLVRAAVPPAAAEESLAVLRRGGLVDDARFARSRAEQLAGRGYGNAAIRHDLAQQGVDGELVAAAVGELEPELERAQANVGRRGPGSRWRAGSWSRDFPCRRDCRVGAAMRRGQPTQELLMVVAIGILIGLVVGGLGGAIAVGALGKSRLGAARQERKQLLDDAGREADTLRREAQISAREAAVQLRAQIDDEVAEHRTRIVKVEERVLAK